MDFLLVGLAEKNLKNSGTKIKLYQSGRILFMTKFEEYNINNDKEKAEDDALVETVIYFKELLKSSAEREMKDYFRFFYGRLN